MKKISGSSAQMQPITRKSCQVILYLVQSRTKCGVVGDVMYLIQRTNNKAVTGRLTDIKNCF
jgi:hypothetical protein